MKRNMIPFISRGLSWLIVWALLLGLVAMPAVAEADPTVSDPNDYAPLKPTDLVYQLDGTTATSDANTAITLHKQAERIGPDEWRVNVSATLTETPVDPPEIEVVFVLDVSSTMNACADMIQHNSYFSGGGFYHTHTDTCPDNCTAIYHVHVSGSPTSHCYKMGGANGTVDYPTRIAIAKEAILTFVTNLPKGTSCKYVTFSDEANDVSNYESLGQYDIQGKTYIMKGVDLGTTKFSKDVNKTHVLVLVTDGMATDNKYSSDTFTSFTDNGGVVFTVGFNHEDPNLEGMVANGGAYYQASNPGELTNAFADIGAKLTAMIEDPMSNVVGFDQVTNQNITSGDGTITTIGNTIYWSPSDNSAENNDLKGTIAYNYTVKLNDDANTDYGMHGATVDDPVPLNNPTYFHYGTANEIKKVDFPIPYAQYGVSTLQTTWKTTDNVTLAATNNTETVIAPTTAGAPEKIVGCDFKNGDGSWYFTDFTQAYSNTNLSEIGVANPTKYLYVGTEVYLNGVKQDGGLKLIDPTQPNAYEVVHIYREVKPGSLIVSKEVTGNMGSRNRDFSFTLTLPAMVNKMISVSRDGGNTYTKLSLNHSGQYTFTLKHGESIAFGDLEGSCTVQEADAAPYSTQYSVNGTPYQSGLSHTIPRVEDTAYTLAFRNTLEATIPTGVFTSSAAAMAGLLLSALMFTITRAGRRARNDE